MRGICGRRAWLVLALCALLSAAVRAETVVWRQGPIPVRLVVGVEQMVMLPTDAEVGLPPTLANPDVFRTLVTGATAYWTALEPFETERVQLRLESGEFLLLDVSATTHKQPPAQVPRLQIVLPEAARTRAYPWAEAHQDAENWFALLRYAAQSLYAPRRLVAPLPGVRSVPVGLAGNLSRLYDGGRQPLMIQAHKAWALGDYHVTTFIVTNLGQQRVVLDNRRIQHTALAERSGVDPHFIASAFHSRALSGRDEQTPRTTLFMVTDRPIRTVVRGLGS